MSLGGKRAPFPSSWQPHGSHARPCGAQGAGGKAQSQQAPQSARRGRGVQGTPIPQKTGLPSPQLPTTPREHLPFSCCFSRICFSERPGEYSRTIKYSSCGSCSISMPLFIQQTVSEGLLGARRRRTSASATAGPGEQARERHAGRRVPRRRGARAPRGLPGGPLPSRRGLHGGRGLSGW